jgi:hypothetical protein
MAGAGTKKNPKKKKAKPEKKIAASKTETKMFRQRLDNFIGRYENWIIFAAGALVLAVLAAFRFSFYYIEGIASITLLVIAVTFLWKKQNFIFPLEFRFSEDSVWLWVGLFTFLGYVFDDAGNFIYNKPLELFCPAATKLTRDVMTIDTVDGAELVQVFSCVSRLDGEATEIAWYLVDLIRIFEYIALGFVLIAIFRAFLWWKSNR